MTKPPNVLLLEGWDVFDHEEKDGELQFHAKPTPYDGKPPCPFCANAAHVEKHDIRKKTVRDTPFLGKPVTIVIHQTLYLCRHCRKTFLLKLSELGREVPIDPKKKVRNYLMTNRCLEFVRTLALQQSFASVAFEVGIDESLVRVISSANVARIKPLREAKPFTTTILGIDDVALLSKGRVVIVDIETRKPIAFLWENKKQTVKDYLKDNKCANTVKVVCMDMAVGFTKAVEEQMPDALIIYDKWHVQRYALQAVSKARIFRQNQIIASAKNNQEKIASMTEIVNYLRYDHTLFHRRRFADFKDDGALRLFQYLERYPDIEMAYRLKERFCDIWSAKDEHEAAGLIDAWLLALNVETQRFKLVRAKYRAWRRRQKIVTPDYQDELDPRTLFKEVVRAITINRKYVLSHFVTTPRYTNAVTEAINGKIKIFNRIGRGYSLPVIEARILDVTPKRIKLKKSHPSKGRSSKKEYNDFRVQMLINRLRPDQSNLEPFCITKCASIGCKSRVTVSITDPSSANESEELDATHMFCEKCCQLRSDYDYQTVISGLPHSVPEGLPLLDYKQR